MVGWVKSQHSALPHPRRRPISNHTPHNHSAPVEPLRLRIGGFHQPYRIGACRANWLGFTHPTRPIPANVPCADSRAVHDEYGQSHDATRSTNPCSLTGFGPQSIIAERSFHSPPRADASAPITGAALLPPRPSLRACSLLCVRGPRLATRKLVNSRPSICFHRVGKVAVALGQMSRRRCQMVRQARTRLISARARPPPGISRRASPLAAREPPRFARTAGSVVAAHREGPRVKKICAARPHGRRR